ncbi:ribonuclease E inhibitor RraB [Streptomyces sp. NPDC089424]|uniref:ribonuclease E inhibitor RraB n=1 Tax=Streptomyces sp. NPDC089424 TaxID=3365917 RepID=UPI0037F36C8C
MSSMIPYTHWAYFPDKASAQACAAELSDYVTQIRQAVPEAHLPWLLLAGRDVEIDHMVQRHDEVEAIVIRHGGDYDGGESSWLEGQPVADPMLTGEWETGSSSG